MSSVRLAPVQHRRITVFFWGRKGVSQEQQIIWGNSKKLLFSERKKVTEMHIDTTVDNLIRILPKYPLKYDLCNVVKSSSYHWKPPEQKVFNTGTINKISMNFKFQINIFHLNHGDLLLFCKNIRQTKKKARTYNLALGAYVL